MVNIDDDNVNMLSSFPNPFDQLLHLLLTNMYMVIGDAHVRKSLILYCMHTKYNNKFVFKLMLSSFM